MIRRLIILLLIVGCRELDDCDGVKRGIAEVDDCGECVRGTTGLVYNYLMDCSGKCNGNATLDDCGVCDSDSINDGVELWGVCYNIAETDTLDLSSNELLLFNRLSGEIPSKISKLVNLKYLDLSFNLLGCDQYNYLCNPLGLNHNCCSIQSINGSIPPEIGDLPKLEYLYLQSNFLNGEIPFEFSNLINLKYLNLSHNQLSGTIPHSLCDLNLIDIFNDNQLTYSLELNEFCPPYPNCIIENLFFQDTSNCP